MRFNNGIVATDGLASARSSEIATTARRAPRTVSAGETDKSRVAKRVAYADRFRLPHVPDRCKLKNMRTWR